MTPFEALYGRGCRSPIGWFEAGDVKPLGVDLVKDAQDKVKSIQAKLLAAQSRQKKYTDHKVRDMTFQTGDNVFLKVSLMKRLMIFGKKGKLSPRYIRPFEVLECVRPVAYRLAFPPNLSGVHSVFHVSMLKRYHGDGDYIIKWDSFVLDKDLQYEEEPVAILDRKMRKLRTKEIKFVKVQGKHRPVEEATWETEKDMRDMYPQLFVDSGCSYVERQSYETPTTTRKGKGKRPISARKTITLDTNIPSWARGFCRAVHVFLEDSHSTELGEFGTVVPPKVTLGTDAQARGEASGTDAQIDGATV
ncbi:hypothetical protein MTR67_043197 [Solanum verrucosum]|uniref:Tf2-1-like SH3-like domain-containing protein n=1 Tax=Solanum verrucosum TaxID=315347 RepID=A0AAF0UP80_SOLVR|nr:hypothetical protein MTR67_043197 [Solanum verrucosum]